MTAQTAADRYYIILIIPAPEQANQRPGLPNTLCSCEHKLCSLPSTVKSKTSDVHRQTQGSTGQFSPIPQKQPVK